MRTTLDLALLRWTVVCEQWSNLASGSHPQLGAFLAGWYACDMGAVMPTGAELGRFKDSYRRGWHEAEQQIEILERT